MVGANHAGYTDKFHELARMVPHLVTPESKRIDRYIRGLVPQIRAMVRATKPTTLLSTNHKAGALTDEAVRSGAPYSLRSSLHTRKNPRGHLILANLHRKPILASL
ncbi:reverse transcriptase domain-containing protein [Artemisia annua]|uniref:Reverse transcriptase domain-containing protein n=1 Tax=Artemisia annua TaxID=35608 RepID=A0A2U1LD41_ARTAN|nr:reverse transcriptase domain-containing protein [Artemisia annua]